MEFIKWNVRYSVGIARADEQHKQLIGLINRLYDAMKARKGKDILGSVLTDVVDYTAYHFGTEEQFFQEYGYPDRDKHRQAHEGLSARAQELLDRFAGGDDAITIDVMLFLSNWLNNHILEEDKKYGPFLNGLGVY